MELFFEKKCKGVCEGHEGVREMKKAKEEI
jgi:hypothetical protein